MSWSQVGSVGHSWNSSASASHSFGEVTASDHSYEVSSSLEGYVFAGYVTPYDVNGKATGYVEPQESGWDRRDRASHEWSEA